MFLMIMQGLFNELFAFSDDLQPQLRAYLNQAPPREVGT